MGSGPFFFTALDPYYLHKLATAIASFPDAIAWSVGSEFYVKWLAIFYQLFGPDIYVYDLDNRLISFGPHIILGQSLTILVFAFSVVVLLWFFDWLNIMHIRYIAVRCLVVGSITGRIDLRRHGHRTRDVYDTGSNVCDCIVLAAVFDQ